MTWIKICGMTNLEDALVAVEAGADAVGFVFYEKSPRCVTVETVREIVEKLPDNVEKIGVIVDTHPADFLAVIHETGLTSCQWYLGENNGAPAMPKGSEFLAPPAGFKLHRAVPANWFIGDETRMRDFTASFAKVEKSFSSPEQGKRAVERLRTIFLDSGTLQQPGGTGKAFDWQGAAGAIQFLQQTVRVVVAGGLTPENVGEAIETLHPWGVDVVSGVEARPGKKDPEKVRAFVRAVREFDRRVD
jgi:phosphoribosylanthranilate isomerase